MIKIDLLNDNLEIVNYNFNNFPIRSKKSLLSHYPNMSAVNHWHDDLEFTIILKGKMSYFVNGQSYELNEGQAIFINSTHMHYGFSSDGSDCSFICILLPPLLIANIDYIINSFVKPICTDSSHPFFIFDKTIPWQNKFIDELLNLYEICLAEKDGFELKVMSIFYSIFYSLYNNFKNPNTYIEAHTHKDLAILHNMIGFIQESYKNKITLLDIAAAGNVCRSKCCEIFKEILNKSPIGYLTEYRLEKSLQLIVNTSLSITEIALQCGFNNSSYFTEMFHKKIGCTPSRYRKSCR